MSRFLSQEASRLAPYTPGEQPKDRSYIKLNSNESPFPPSPKAVEAVSRAALQGLNLYSDATCAVLNRAIADTYGLQPENVLSANGSDEILAFLFRAFCGTGTGVAYADVTYSFYKSQTALFGLDATVIPLREDFTLAIDDYLDFPGVIVIANPNAPTGMALPRSEIQRLLDADRNRLVVVDEAYVDFGAESCVPLIPQYDNLLVVQTMSKSRSLAGARLGFALGCADLIADLNRVKYSFNPYNVNRMTLLAGTASMQDTAYFNACCTAIQQARAWTTEALETLGFTVLPSQTNFILAKSGRISGQDLYRGLRERGILIRWFDSDRIREYVRITIGSMEQMRALVDAVSAMLDAQ